MHGAIECPLCPAGPNVTSAEHVQRAHGALPEREANHFREYLRRRRL